MPRREITGQRQIVKMGTPPKALNKRIKRILDRSKNTDKYNYSLITNEVTSTASFVQFFSPTQGDGEKQRIGDTVEPIKIWARYTLDTNAIATFRYVRFMIFQWRPDNAIDAPDNLNKLFEGPTDPNSDYIYDASARKKFRVLYDKFHHLPPTALYDNPIVRTINIPRKKLSKVRFADGATTGRNCLYYMIVGNSATGSDFSIYMTTSYKET